MRVRLKWSDHFLGSEFQSRELSAIGVTIHYRGTVADLERIEDLEDRLLDLALDLGGQVQIWRSSDAGAPRRIVRGLIPSSQDRKTTS